MKRILKSERQKDLKPCVRIRNQSAHHIIRMVFVCENGVHATIDPFLWGIFSRKDESAELKDPYEFWGGCIRRCWPVVLLGSLHQGKGFCATLWLYILWKQVESNSLIAARFTFFIASTIAGRIVNKMPLEEWWNDGPLMAFSNLMLGSS